MATRRPSHGTATKAGVTGKAPPLGRALIVEDDTILAMMIADALRDEGAEYVAISPSVASALTELDRLRPDILILDVHLADRDDGWTLAELVIELSPSPPIIVFSTGAPQSIPVRVAGLGTVLEKPFTTAQLIDAVRQHSRHRGLLSRLRDALSHTAE